MRRDRIVYRMVSISRPIDEIVTIHLKHDNTSLKDKRDIPEDDDRRDIKTLSYRLTRYNFVA